MHLLENAPRAAFLSSSSHFVIYKQKRTDLLFHANLLLINSLTPQKQNHVTVFLESVEGSGYVEEKELSLGSDLLLPLEFSCL